MRLPLDLENTGAPLELELFFLGNYAGTLKDWIGLQKTAPTAQFTRAAARCLAEALPEPWLRASLLWVPARAFQDTHLVERLALDLGRCGIKSFPRPVLRRAFFSWQVQKQKKLEARQASTRRFQTAKRFPGLQRNKESLPIDKELLPFNQHLLPPVLLLDDVVTSGSTLRDCALLARQELKLNVLGAVSLAYTELR